MENNKSAVRDFWDAASCGEELYMQGTDAKAKFNNQLQERYRLEPYILSFADFKNYFQKQVLEIGVGLGADHQKFAESGADLYGCDLTPRAVEYTKERLELFGLSSRLQVADAEKLPFKNEQFDLVYSWGVIHHSPDTPQCIKEIYRVLKPGSEAKVMIYHTSSFVGYMLWMRYALLKGQPFTSLRKIYSTYLESPGTKAYTISEAQQLFKDFSKVEINTVLTHGDLLRSKAGQRHEGLLLDIARKIWPRFLIRTYFAKHGLFMLIHATK